MGRARPASRSVPDEPTVHGPLDHRRSRALRRRGPGGIRPCLPALRPPSLRPHRHRPHGLREQRHRGGCARGSRYASVAGRSQTSRGRAEVVTWTKDIITAVPNAGVTVICERDQMTCRSGRGGRRRQQQSSNSASASVGTLTGCPVRQVDRLTPFVLGPERRERQRGRSSSSPALSAAARSGDGSVLLARAERADLSTLAGTQVIADHYTKGVRLPGYAFVLGARQRLVATASSWTADRHHPCAGQRSSRVAPGTCPQACPRSHLGREPEAAWGAPLRARPTTRRTGSAPRADQTVPLLGWQHRRLAGRQPVRPAIPWWGR